MTTLACFVSSHGFGHAARTCAVITALARRNRSLGFHIFTTVPEWFFVESLSDSFVYHQCSTDVGMIQISPLEEDLRATMRALDAAPWRDAGAVERSASLLRQLKCSLVLADISPFGLRVARHAGLPSVLIENFTWDWIYRRIEGAEELVSYADELAAIFAGSDLRIETAPACHHSGGAIAVGPVARSPRHSRAEIRRRLAIPQDAAMVLASMGGLGWDYPPLERPWGGDEPWIVVPGGADLATRRGRLLLLPFQSSHFHPDLVGAADVVIGKLGYSTVAEVWHGRTAMAYVERPLFPESQVLARFVDRHVPSVVLEKRDFELGRWNSAVQEVLGAGRPARRGAAGADDSAAAMIRHFPDVFA